MLLFMLTACGDPSPTVLSGESMGARYHITIGDRGVDTDAIEAEVAELLESIESQASQWREASWVTRFNRDASLRPVPAPEHVWSMLIIAEAVHGDSGGALDITAGPLVELWGFGAEPREAPPSEDELAAVMRHCGSDKLLLDIDTQAVGKAAAGLTIDLSALGKGYAVDRIAELLDEHGVSNYLIAFGGEVRARGDGPGGDGWVVAIDSPGAAGRTLTLRDQACATSGGAEQHHVLDDGRVVTHLIDPRMGRPIEDASRAVTVIGDRCAEADAWATALSVLSKSERTDTAGRAGVEWLSFD